MFSIGKFAEAGGVGVETIRFYQRKGLLGIPDQSTGMRRYGHEDLRRLRFIRTARNAGFTLEEIKELIALDATQDRLRARELANSKLKLLEAKIEELQAARDALKRLATECGKGKSGPCPILESFGI